MNPFYAYSSIALHLFHENTSVKLKPSRTTISRASFSEHRAELKENVFGESLIGRKGSALFMRYKGAKIVELALLCTVCEGLCPILRDFTIEDCCNVGVLPYFLTL